VRLYVGIDPGLDGGIVVVTDLGELADSCVMPTQEHVHQHGSRTTRRRSLSEPRVRDVFLALPQSPALVTMEALSRGHPGLRGVNSALAMGLNHGLIRGLLCGLFIPHLLTPARKWQAAMLGSTSGDTKARSIELAQQLLPRLDLTPGKRTTPHDGLADAAMLALYGMRIHGTPDAT
jgi:hypothetical protein